MPYIISNIADGAYCSLDIAIIETIRAATAINEGEEGNGMLSLDKRNNDEYNGIIEKIIDVIIAEKCTVDEAFSLLSSVRRKIEESPVQKAK